VNKIIPILRLDILFFFLLFIITICSQACHLTPLGFSGFKSQWENKNSAGFSSKV